MPSKHTKIVCTIGPASHDPAMLENMIKAGMNVARLNFSHGTHEDHAKMVGIIKEAAAKAGVPAVVFSSTAAVYGEPAAGLLDESLPTAPINPYGASKAMSERVLTDIAAATGLRYGILRYFNVAGADAEARIGEATPDNAHLIKLACEAALGLRPGMEVVVEW